VKKTMLFLLLALAALASGARAEDSASPATATAKLGPPWDKVQLKDGQAMLGKIQSYDGYYLVIAGQNGHAFSLPWAEISGVEQGTLSGDTAMMRQHISNEAVEVKSHIEPKDAGSAFRAALFPGVLFHGFGYHVAGNQDMFLSLAGAESFGVIVAAFGAGRALDSSASGYEKQIASSLVWGGLGLFAVTWAWDLIGSPSSASSYNAEAGLSLAPLPQGGAQLGYSRSF
jgi:hypothetical protein